MTPFTAVVPVKQFRRAKTRLSEDPLLRSSLAKAFVEDVVAALVGASMIESVVVVVSHGEDEDGPRWRSDVQVVHEPVSGAGSALNAAVGRGMEWCIDNRPHAPVVVVPSDLATLTPAPLDAALVLASTHDRSHVADASGDGTTLVTALHASDLRSRYGPGSARRHGRAGFTALDRVDIRLRLDVDTLEDLRAATPLGLGPATTDVVRRLAPLA